MKADKLVVNGSELVWGKRTYIMGVLNLTDDSFSGDGLFTGTGKNYIETAIGQARQFIDAGVDILDIGGESTRPGANPLGVEEEMERVIPVVSAIAAEFDTLISVDTYKAAVAKAALNSGANLVNDVWGLKADPEMSNVVARSNAPVILMHNRSSWAHAQIKENLGGRYVGMEYEDLMQDVRRELLESISLAQSAGVPDENIILDPGIGFGKTVEQNLELIDRLSEFQSLGYPILLGPSRKSFIGFTLDLPPNQRLEGTAAVVVVSITRGADIVRVHDVEFMSRLIRMTDAIVRRK